MFCHKCGSQQIDGAEFCTQCGVNLIKINEEQQTSENQAQSQFEIPKKSKKGLIIGLASASAAIIISVVLFITLFYNPSNASNTSDDSTARSRNKGFDDVIETVKNGALEFYPSKTLDEAFSGFLSNVNWDAERADNDTIYISVTGGALYNDMPVDIIVRYRIIDDEKFEFSSIHMDDEKYGFTLYFELIVKTYETEIFNIVNKGALYSYPDVTMGEAFSELFDDIEWEVVAGEDGNVYVNIGGTLLFYGTEAYAVVQYLVDTIEQEFIYNAFEIDGWAQDFDMYLQLIDLAFDDGDPYGRIDASLGNWRGNAQLNGDGNYIYVDNKRQNDWYYVYSAIYTTDNSDKYFTAGIRCDNLGIRGRVYMTDLVIREYDKNGRFVRNVYDGDVYQDTLNGYFTTWAEDDSGYYGTDDEFGVAFISGVSIDAGATFTTGVFEVVPGYSYDAECYVYLENCGTNVFVTANIDFFG